MLPLLASLVWSAAPASPNLQAVRVYPLLIDTPRNCVDIATHQNGLHIILDRDEVTRIQKGSSSHGTPAQRRMGAIRSRRTQKLLEDTSKLRDRLGCRVNATLANNRKAFTDWAYLVFYIFEQGDGRVWSVQSGIYLKKYRYVTYGAHCGWCPAGFETLETLQGSPFLSAELYVR